MKPYFLISGVVHDRKLTEAGSRDVKELVAILKT